jgi:hypothetical protein
VSGKSLVKELIAMSPEVVHADEKASGVATLKHGERKAEITKGRIRWQT